MAKKTVAGVHKKSQMPKHLANKFDNSENGTHNKSHSPGKNKDGLSGYNPGGMLHKEVHHATHGGHKGHLGEHKLAGSHKISTRPMGAFHYKEVFGKGNK